MDRISKFDLQVQNESDQPRVVRLRIKHDYHPISGYVPMIMDATGQFTGLPLQNSKNWHKQFSQPYQGNWIHVSTRFVAPPQSTISWQYQIAHAQWEGLPASSLAQLSLVGWGFNGFWVQMALGSWGETLCLQPGRTMRRAFITDVRLLMVAGKHDKPYDWTTNVGGGDIAKIINEDGKLVVWQGATQDYRRIGPNLSQFAVRERSDCGHLELKIESFLPRSRSVNRSYFKVELFAREDFAFSDLTLFQLGSDYYNVVDCRQVAWEDASGLTDSFAPPAKKWGQVMDATPLAGEQPWFTLFDTNVISKTEGGALRGAVLRSFGGTLNGKPIAEPWLASARTKETLNAEVRLDPAVKKLLAGDRIEFVLEMLVFPIDAMSYRGSDSALKDRLKQSADSWELTAYESAIGSVRVDGEQNVFPATLDLSGGVKEFSVSASGGLVSVLLEGVPRPSQWRIMERFNGELVELGSRFPEERMPQMDYMLESEQWTAVLSLRFDDDETRLRRFILVDNYD